MSTQKLIKSFIVVKDCDKLTKGDIITLKRFQAQIPLVQDELWFESGAKNFTFNELIKLLQNHHIEVKNYFNSIQEKFDHIT